MDELEQELNQNSERSEKDPDPKRISSDKLESNDQP